MKTPLSIPFPAVLVSGLFFALPIRADITGDLSFTAFPNPDLSAMAGGQVLQARGGLIEFERGITTQSLFIVDAAPAAVQDKLLHWDPTSHGELKVWLNKSLPPQPAPADFGALANLPDNRSVNYVINATAQADAALQLNPSERQLLLSSKGQASDKKAHFVTVWSQILSDRMNNFLTNHVTGDVYEDSEGNIDPLSEIRSLLRSDIKIYAKFHPLIAQSPVLGSAKGKPTDLYFESFDIQGEATLCLGADYVMAGGTSVQVADMEFYLSSGIYTSVELHQLWPITINGRNETLVWRDDLVSTSNVAYLHGTERLASGMIMLQDVKQAIDAFRSEFK